MPTGFYSKQKWGKRLFSTHSERQCQNFSFSVYNRWGEMVYNYNSKDKIGWDGKFNGE